MLRAAANSKRRTSDRASRKPKFQADLAPAEYGMVSSLKAELQLNSNSDFFAEAVTLFNWAVSERKRGHKIVSETGTGEKRVLVLPRLERVAPEYALPHVDVEWSAKELESLAKLASSQPAEPSDALVRAMRG